MSGERGVRGLRTSEDAAIDELYANAPATFTKKRDELAKRLKAEGKADVAATVKALHRPTQIAYVLNQVARRFTDEVGELVDVGRELARAQRKALRGGDASDELRSAIERQRKVVRDLTTKTGALMREIDVSATGHLDEIAGALQAALVDPVVGAQLEEGRLEKVPEPAAGFPGAAPQPELRLVPPPRPKAEDKQAAARAEREERAREREAEREAKARAKKEAARKKLDAKAAALEAKRQVALAHARAAAEKAKARAESLLADAEEARRTAETLRADAERLSKEAKDAARAADAAETKADETTKEAKAAEREAARLATKARAK